jgi:hypothetical protein
LSETYVEVEERPMFVLELEGVKHFECILKHLCALHGLGWEWITTITSTQLAEVKGNCDDVFRKTLLISSVTSEVEEILDEFLKEFMLKEVADATGQIRLSKADIHQFIWQYGHFVLAEEHFADYISLYVKRLQNAQTEEEKKRLQQKILDISNFLYVTRLERKKYLSGFLEKVSPNRANEMK